MDKKEDAEGETEVEISADAIAIADAIFAGFTELAGAVRELARSMNDGMSPDEEQRTERYLDGSKVR